MPRNIQGMWSSLREHLALIILCALFWVVAFAATNDLCLYTPDSTRYLAWSVSLSEFNGFFDGTSPEPERYVVHAPLYAALLAPVARVFPYSIVAAKILTLCIGVVVLLLFYRLLAARLSPRSALVGTALLAANSLFLLFSTELLSDVPFVAVLLSILLVLERKGDGQNITTGRLIVLVILLTIAVLLRELGVAIVGAVVGTMILRRDYRSAIVATLVPAVFYLLWWYRNEMVVAAVEMPALTNARLFTSHFFTPPDASLLTELLARAAANARRYGSVVSGLLFFPVYATPQFDVVAKNAAVVSSVVDALSWAKYILAILAGGLTLPGIVTDVRTNRSAITRLLFLALYLGIVLAYPINDVRFLLPLLVLMIFYSMITIETIEQRSRSAGIRGMIYAGLAIAMVPVFIWNGAYVSNSLSYQRSPAEFFARVGSASQYPSHFAKPLPLAGEWLRQNSDAQSVIMSQWKDLAASLGGRKLLNADQTIPSEEFDAMIRDYRVRYLVAVRQKNGLREFEFQMSQSRRFSFTRIQEIAALEIYSVGPKREAPSSTGSPFGRAFVSLGNGKYQEAVAILDTLTRRDPLNPGAMFYSALARECAGDLHGAAEVFRRLSTFPQAGMFLDQARQHLIVLADLERAAQSTVARERSDRLMNAGMGLWSRGIRRKGAELLYQAATIDSTNIPAITLAVLFAMEEGNLQEIRGRVASISGAGRDYPLGKSVLGLARQRDSLRLERTPEGRSTRLSGIGDIFAEIGLIERAIDLHLAAIAEDARRTESYESLIRLYERKRRIGPAYAALGQLLRVDASNAFAHENEALLRARFE